MLRRIADGRVQCARLQVLETQKTAKKLMRDLRVSADDFRRLKQIHYGIRGMVVDYEPVAVVYEVYQPFTGSVKGRKGLRSSSWKVGRVEGVIVSVGVTAEVLVLPYLPVDLKTKIAGKRSATKLEVQEALLSKIVGLADALDAIPEKKREHVADAAGYAYLAFEEMENLARMIGVQQ